MHVTVLTKPLDVACDKEARVQPSASGQTPMVAGRDNLLDPYRYDVGKLMSKWQTTLLSQTIVHFFKNVSGAGASMASSPKKDAGLREGLLLP